MRIVTYNINSIRARMERFIPWLEEEKPEVVCLQETKSTDETFPWTELESLGYEVAHVGQTSYNGVAILSRLGIEDVDEALPGDSEDKDARLVAATCGDVRVISVYVPNGRSLESDHYQYKLRWLERLHSYLAEGHSPDEPIVLCGDFNVAPEPRDVYDPALWEGRVLFTEAEKQAFRKLLEWGMVDAFRLLRKEDDIYTWWDYRMGAFWQNRGLRIDHLLITKPLVPQVTEALMDREMRKGTRPSDHAPVSIELDLEPSGTGAE